MWLRFSSVMLLMTPFALLAEEQAEVVEVISTIPPIPEGAPIWVQVLWPLLFATLLPFIMGFLKEKERAAIAEAEKIELDANECLMEQKNLLIDKRVIPYLWSTASHFAEGDLPKILADALNKDKKFDWSGYSKKIGKDLLESVIDKFAAEGIDIVKTLGEKYLGELINRAIAKAIPWLPQATQPFVENLAEGKGQALAQAIVSRGLNEANDRWLKGALPLSETE